MIQTVSNSAWKAVVEWKRTLGIDKGFKINRLVNELSFVEYKVDQSTSSVKSATVSIKADIAPRPVLPRRSIRHNV